MSRGTSARLSRNSPAGPTPRRRARGVVRWAVRWASAPLLILAAPFTAYLQHHHYGWLQPEALLFFALFAAVAVLLGMVASRGRAAEAVVLAALLTFMVDVQAPDVGVKALGLILVAAAAVMWLLHRNAARLVTVTMATMCAVSLIPRSSASSPPTTAPGNRGLPLLVHVVLDEHLGVAGMPADLVPPEAPGDLEQFFVSRGFRLFGAAYSEFPETKWSLPHLLNLVSGEYRDDLARPGETEDTYRLTRNEYFARMTNAGYAIRVYQPDYLDVCATVVTAAACETYPARNLDGVQRIAVPAAGKLRALGGSYLFRSEAYRRARQAYRDVRRQLPSTQWRPPAWNWERVSVAPVGSFAMFDRVAADLASASRGDLVFAHFLLPHYPYVYDAECRPRPVAGWMERSSDARQELGKGTMNTPESRADRYRLYFEQLACTRSRLARLLDAIPAPLREDAIVIVHGDHGSRITLSDPVTTIEDRLLMSDYADNYSTLFAVRAGPIAGGYEPRPLAISCVLAALVESDFRSVDMTRPCAADGQLFLRHDTAPKARPLRAFWQHGSAAPIQAAAAPPTAP
jgi:hypothetical protein